MARITIYALAAFCLAANLIAQEQAPLPALPVDIPKDAEIRTVLFDKTLDRELEIYNEAGIPAAEVLRIATIEAAKVMHKDQDLGSITPGKYADMILVNGDPTIHMSDIRHIDMVVKNGDVYRPSEMYPAFGIRPE